MFYGNIYKNKETARRLICHYGLFNQIIRLKKADEQTNVVWQCCIGLFTWRPAYVLLLLATEISHQRVLVQHLAIYLFSWQLHVTQQRNEFLCFSCNSGYANAPQCYIVRTLPVLFKFDLVLSLFYVFSFVVCVLVLCSCAVSVIASMAVVPAH
jgi:ABC-type microcin C transport system permease subunit YejE